MDIKSRYLMDYKKYESEIPVSVTQAPSESYTLRTELIKSLGFEGHDGDDRHVFNLYHVGMIAHLDQDCRYVGYVTRPLMKIEELDVHRGHLSDSMHKHFRYTHICLDGNVQHRLQTIKDIMINTSWLVADHHRR